LPEGFEETSADQALDEADLDEEDEDERDDEEADSEDEDDDDDARATLEPNDDELVTKPAHASPAAGTKARRAPKRGHTSQ
jgi:hypothetical protein